MSESYEANRPDLDEVTLVARAQDGDVMAFERLVDSYQGQLFRLAYSMLRDRGQAEDVVQESLVKVWRHLDGLADPATFPKWVYQITTRATLNHLRSQQRRPALPSDPMAMAEGTRERVGGGPATDPADLTESRAVAEALRTEVARLPEEQRLCWTLYADHGRSYEEIADIVGISHSTVRGRIARARQRLAEGMTSWR